MTADQESLIGRATEVRLIAEAVAGGAASKRMLVLRGEAGIGKTALLDHALAVAEQAAHICALARAPAAGALPYGFPVPQIIRGIARGLDSRGADLPATVGALADGSRSGSSTSEHRTPDLLQIAAAFEETAAISPLAICLDDLQWMPEQGRELIYAALRVVESPILVVATERRAAKARAGSAVLPEPSADLAVTLVDIGGLDIDSCHLLASRELESDVLPSLTSELFHRCMGNPLYLLETVRAWRQVGTIARLTSEYWGFTSGDPPMDSPSLIELISRRLRSIPSDALETAKALAALARPSHFEELNMITGKEPGRLADGLSTLEDLGFIEADPAAGAYRLAHPLFQAALLGSMSETRKAELHDRVFSALSAAAGSSPRELAHHAVRGLKPPGDLVPLLESAALHADDAGDHAEAADWYERLARLAVGGPAHVRAIVGQAAAVEYINPAEAVRLYESAYPLVENEDEQAKMLLGKGRALRVMGRLEEALTSLEEAASLAVGELKLEARETRGAVLGSIGRVTEAARDFEFVATHSVGTLLRTKAKAHLGLVAYARGDLQQAIDHLREGLEAGPDVSYLLHLQSNLAWFLVLAGQWQEARRVLAEGTERARQAGDTWFLLSFLVSAIRLAAFEGNFGTALDLAAEAQRIDRRTQSQTDRIITREAIARVLMEKGNYVEAASILAEMPSLVASATEPSEVVPALVVLSEASFGIGDLGTAMHWAQEARRYVSFNVTWAQAVEALHANLALGRGEPQQALALIVSSLKQPGPIPTEQAWMSELGARAQLELGHREEAIDYAHTALGIYDDLGARPRADRVRRWIEANSKRPKGRPRTAQPHALTGRELEILRLIEAGKTNPEVAKALSISPGTVKKHVENIKLKLGARRRTELVAHAARLTQIPEV